ncbi:phosphotransferase [Rubeoparvulum massiliense]|uniref:phosphotransferase n=1 Tax=Rubeoparvulum massiliense TaxID=1631346 RepID=UPI00065E7130|nr:phosphotransferase [Rubeoparvulum massiliense]
MRRNRKPEPTLAEWLLQHYDLKLKQMSHIRQQVYRITDWDHKIWVWKRYKRWELLADQEAVFLHLQKRGFQQFVPFVRTRDGKSYAPYQQGYAVLMPWISGREVQYRSWEQTLKALQTLHGFHHAAREITLPYQPPLHSFTMEGQWRDRLNSLIQQEELGQLYQFLFPPLSLRYQPFIKEVLGEGVRFFQKFPHALFQQEKMKALEKKQVVHHDLASHNFMEGQDGHVYLIDFDQIQHDLILTDLNQLAERFLFAQRWQLRPAIRLLHTIMQNWSLRPQQLQLLLYSLYYPNFLLRTWAGFIQQRKGYDEHQLLFVTQSGYRHWQLRHQTLQLLEKELNAFA